MNQEKIGAFIAKCRKQKKLTQVELADILSVSDKSVSKWENGRCMPDLSLFPKLCETLGITINDLMSGEKVDEKKYLNNLEENIVNMVVSIEEKKNKTRKIFLTSSIIVIFSILSCYLFYHHYEEPVKYDERVIKCNIENNELYFQVLGLSILNNYHTTRKIEDKTIFFFHSTLSLENKRASHWEYSNTMARLLNNEEIYGHDERIEISGNVEAYYTNSSINKIKKSTEEELKEIMRNSYLMCRSN